MAEPILPQSKICTKCKLDKPLSEYGKHKQGKYGLRARCLVCHRAENREYISENRDACNAASLAWYHANREHVAERMSAWQKENPDKVNAKSKRWRDKNRHKIASYNRVYKEENKSVIAVTAKQWRLSNRDKAIMAKHRRRARKKSGGGTYTAEDIQRLLKLQNGRCTVCRKPLAGEYHIDHIVALAKGGSNGPHNLQLLHPLCNRRKSSKDPIEFMQEQGFLL